jgi:hypothetical protein
MEMSSDGFGSIAACRETHMEEIEYLNSREAFKG